MPEFPLLLPFPETQPITPIEINTVSSPSIASQLRLRLGTTKNSSSASAVPPADGQNSSFFRFSALVAAVVVTVSVEVCAAVPLIVSEVGERLHVTGSTASIGATEQLRLTVPVNPFAGVTVMAAVFPVVAPDLMVSAEPLNEKVGAAVTVRAMVVDAVSVPEVPLMVTVTGPPMAAVLLAVSVSTLALVPGFGAKDAVTPLGRPVAESVTPLENPPASVTETVLVPLLPSAIDRVDGEEESAKLSG